MNVPEPIKLSFVTCVSNHDVLAKRLLASPCLRDGDYPLVAYFNAQSAAQAFNATALGVQSPNSWLIWVHQDVHLPLGWDTQFLARLREAQVVYPALAVVGVYGVAGTGAEVRRAGHVLDRGRTLREPAPLPCLVDSLDELLFAVRCDSGLKLDPALAWDFYATDLVLQAQSTGYQAAVVDAYCEHWSDTPNNGPTPARLLDRIDNSAKIFETKWAHRLPITTSCFDINKPGDVSALVRSIATRLTENVPRASD